METMAIGGIAADLAYAVGYCSRALGPVIAEDREAS